jgi:hypothetical protein
MSSVSVGLPLKLWFLRRPKELPGVVSSITAEARVVPKEGLACLKIAQQSTGAPPPAYPP